MLSLWAVGNLIPSTVILVTMVFGWGHTPALYTVLSEEEVSALSAEALSTIDSIAVYANGCNIAFCLLSLFAIWLGLNRSVSWAFWALLVGFAAALFAGVAAGIPIGTVFPLVNGISAAILVLGFSFAARGLFFRRRTDSCRS